MSGAVISRLIFFKLVDCIYPGVLMGVEMDELARVEIEMTYEQFGPLCLCWKSFYPAYFLVLPCCAQQFNVNHAMGPYNTIHVQLYCLSPKGKTPHSFGLVTMQP